MAAGIKVGAEIQNRITEITKNNSSFRYVTFRLTDDLTKLEEKSVASKKDDETWAEFCEAFPDDICGFGVYNLPVRKKGNDADKPYDEPITVAWNGPTTKIKMRMCHSTTINDFKKICPKQDTFMAIDGRTELQDVNEICKDAFRGKLVYVGEKGSF